MNTCSRSRLARSALISSVLVLLLFSLSIPPAAAEPIDEPRIALMVHPHAVKNPYDPLLPDGTDPVTIPGDEFVTRGEVNRAYDVYLVVVGGHPDQGIAGVSCGILYDGESGSGVDVMHWTLFADLEYPNGIDPLNASMDWPQAGGGNRILWDRLRNCQLTQVGDEGVHAVAGSFYVFAYSDDVFWVTPNRNLWSGPELVTLGCELAMADVPATDVGHVVFSSDPADDGCNPCLGPCPPAPPGPPMRIPKCVVEPQSISFGYGPLGEPRVQTCVIRNDGHAPLKCKVQMYCPSVFRGFRHGEEFELAPGDSLVRELTFLATKEGPYYCHIQFGASYPVLYLRAYGGYPPEPECVLIPLEEINFGEVEVGKVAYRSFRVTNRGGGLLIGTTSLDCPEFKIVGGKGGYTLGRYEVRAVVVRFSPSAPGDYECYVDTGEECANDIHCVAVGIPADEDEGDGDTGDSESGGTPVRLISFDAGPAEGGVLLRWETETETDHAGFQVLRAEGGQETRLTSALLVSGPVYSFLDRTGRSGSAYDYWLEAIARDGTRERFGPRFAVYPESGLSLRAYPNPAHAGEPVRFEVAGSALVDADLFDLAGRRLQSWHGADELARGWDGRLANGAPAAPGVYFLRVRSADTVRSVRLVLTP